MVTPKGRRILLGTFLVGSVGIFTIGAITDPDGSKSAARNTPVQHVMTAAETETNRCRWQGHEAGMGLIEATMYCRRFGSAAMEGVWYRKVVLRLN